MYNYAPVRWVKKIIGTTSAGNPIWGGPYEVKRDLPIAGAAVVVAGSLCGAGFVAARLAGAVVGLLAAAVMLGSALYAIGRLRRSPEGFSIDHWVGSKIDLHFARPTLIEGSNPFHPFTAPAAAPKALGTVDVIDDNIRVTATGQYWAEYRVGNPLEMGLVGRTQQDAVLCEHQALFNKVMRNGVYIAQVKEPISENELTEQAFTDEDAEPDDVPMYSKLVCDQIDELRAQTTDHGLGRWPHRINYLLAFYVGDSAATAAKRRDEIISDLPFTWELTPATRAQMYWSWYAQCTSSIKMVATNQPDIPEQLPSIVIEDGAHSDSMFSKGTRWFYRQRDLLPVLKVSVGDAKPSYQAILKAKLPDALDFPHETDFLSVLRHMGEPINCAIRATPKTRETAREENRKNEGTIEDNTEELAPFDRRVDPYARENELLAAYNAKLEDPTSAALTYTLFVAVAAPEAVEVKRIRTRYEMCWRRWASTSIHPRQASRKNCGRRCSRARLARRQWTTGPPRPLVSEFAELVPFTTASIGHADGPVIGRNLTSGLGDLVRFAAEKLILAGRAAAIAIVSSVGGGKSTLGKLLAIVAHAAGGPLGCVRQIRHR